MFENENATYAKKFEVAAKQYESNFFSLMHPDTPCHYSITIVNIYKPYC